MDIPQPNIPQMGMPFRGTFPGQLPPSNQPPMMNMQGMSMRMMPNNMINAGSVLSDQEEKKKQFARAVYVSGFQKTLTTAMIQKHFETIKPVIGIKLPCSKLGQNKGFAFLYFSSEDDATLVKKQLDRSVILRDKIRVTKTVVAENLSKMIFKMKCKGLSEKAIQDIEKQYFNDESLEREVERIISPVFGKTVQVNKIIVPTSKKEKKSLTYARVFFYISNLKEAVAIARRSMAETGLIQRPDKNQYEVILGQISELLNKEDKFSRVASAQIYEYTKKNQSNVLHIKGLKLNKGESPNALADELKEFIQNQNMQWQIINCYVAFIEGKGAWANITFQTYEDTVKAYEHLKSTRPKFRELPLYGSLRNVKDLRTVVFSVVKKDTDQKTVYRFLRELADNSKVIPAEGEALPFKKYDFFSFNIIQQKTFFITNEGNQIGATEDQRKNIQESWRQNNTVPRRLVVHFFNDMEDQDIKELLNDIKLRPEHKEVFIEDNKTHPLRANHQKGHIKDNFYIKHADLTKKKAKRQPPRERQERMPRGPRQDNNNQQRPRHNNGQGPTQPKFDYSSFAPKGGVPRFTPGTGSSNYNMRPPMVPMGGSQIPIGNMPVNGTKPPMMGNQAPMMGGQVPMMGTKPVMMGNQPPMMGSQIPMMGSQIPMMGTKTGIIPPSMGMNPTMISRPNVPGSSNIVPPKQ